MSFAFIVIALSSLATMSATFDRFRNNSQSFHTANGQCFKKPLEFREPARKGSRSNQSIRKIDKFDHVAAELPEDEDIPSPFEIEGRCTSPTNRVECLKYQNLSDSLKRDINHLIKYDNFAEKLVTEQKPEKIKTPPTEKFTRKSDDAVLDSAFSSKSEAMHKITQKDIENLREFVRMDRGLPLTRQPKLKSIDVFREPLIRPRMNRASTIRVKHSHGPADSPKFRAEAATAFKLTEEQMLARLKRLAAHYRKLEDPTYKFNWGFEMRYQSNKGNPSMPSSFRQSYETYNKPLFHVPKKLELPKRYLWPTTSRHEISYLGFRMDGDLIPLQYQKKPEKLTRKKKEKRKLKKTKRVLRRKQSPKGKKIPWNYGMFQKD